MRDEFTINDQKIDFSDYFNLYKCSEEVKSKLNFTGILAVPQKYKENEYYFAKETIDFLKYCKQQQSDYPCDVLAEGDIQIRSLHSFDIWLPVIYIASNFLVPVVVNLVSDYIFNKMKGRENESAKVDFTMLLKDGKKEKIIHYSGDAKTFKESFEKIDITKL